MYGVPDILWPEVVFPGILAAGNATVSTVAIVASQLLGRFSLPPHLITPSLQLCNASVYRT